MRWLLNILICTRSVPRGEGNEIKEKIEIKIKLVENEVESLIQSIAGQRQNNLRNRIESKRRFISVITTDTIDSRVEIESESDVQLFEKFSNTIFSKIHSFFYRLPHFTRR